LFLNISKLDPSTREAYRIMVQEDKKFRRWHVPPLLPAHMFRYSVYLNTHLVALPLYCTIMILHSSWVYLS